MITTLEEYEKLCRKTLSFKYDSQVRALEDVSLHSVMGLVTEAVELGSYSNIENLKEELGDYCWYLAILTKEAKLILNVSTNQEKYCEGNIFIKAENFNSLVSRLIKNSCSILDKYKKLFYYGKEININSLREDIHNCWLIIQDICQLFNINIYEIFQLNIDKLKKRYGDKFTEEAAINRDIDNEMSHFKN